MRSKQSVPGNTTSNRLVARAWSGELLPGPYAVPRSGLFDAGALSVANFGAIRRADRVRTLAMNESIALAAAGGSDMGVVAGPATRCPAGGRKRGPIAMNLSSERTCKSSRPDSLRRRLDRLYRRGCHRFLGLRHPECWHPGKPEKSKAQ